MYALLYYGSGLTTPIRAIHTDVTEVPSGNSNKHFKCNCCGETITQGLNSWITHEGNGEKFSKENPQYLPCTKTE